MSERPNEDLRPVHPRTGARLPQVEQPGYYPGYRTLSQRKFWDAATRELVLDRVNNVPPIRFFTPEQARLLTAICDRVLPQDDRLDAFRIPIVPQIDKRLFLGLSDGYRFEDMPSDGEAYRLGLKAIREMAHAAYGRAFTELRAREQEELLQSLHDAKPVAAHDVWDRMPVHRFWMLLVQDCVEAYYAHPWAWDEVGYGGPAYPRAYTRLERGEPEPWERKEKRYEWAAPPDSLSGEYSAIAGEDEHHATPGQGGTH